MQTAQFDKDLVIASLKMVGEMLDRRIRTYLVGGGAMALRGEKDATKDVDLILETDQDAKDLRSKFIEIGFSVHLTPPLECNALTDACIVEDVRGMRVDIFVGTICRKLHFSPGMIGRSERYGLLGNLDLFICAREDIFLLKSVTERSKDLKDMAALYAKGLNGQIIIDECAEQTVMDADNGGRIWETFLVTKMEELEAEVEITIPWMGEVKKVAEKRLMVSLIMRTVAEGVTNVPAISTKLKLDQVTVRKTLVHLEREGLLSIDRTSRPHRISTKK